MKLPRTSGGRVIKVLKSYGFQEIRIKGSHHYLVNPDTGAIVTVPVHSGKTFAPKLSNRLFTLQDYRQTMFIAFCTFSGRYSSFLGYVL